MQLKGAAAIVTGGGSGIGKAIAKVFAEEGASVVVADWNHETGAATVEEVHRGGGTAVFCPTDVSKAKDVERMVGKAVEQYGKLDILVNDAAIQILARLADTSEEDWDRLHSVNLKGVFLGCKYAIPVMVRSGGGSIVNIASILGFVGDPDLAAYCAAKGGVIALTRAAALSYGPDGIRINCICPGDVDTPMVQEYFDKDPNPEALRRQIYQHYALRRIASPEEIARVAVFLASKNSSFITGGTLVVDGGLTVKCY